MLTQHLKHPRSIVGKGSMAEAGDVPAEGTRLRVPPKILLELIDACVPASAVGFDEQAEEAEGAVDSAFFTKCGKRTLAHERWEPARSDDLVQEAFELAGGGDVARPELGEERAQPGRMPDPSADEWEGDILYRLDGREAGGEQIVDGQAQPLCPPPAGDVHDGSLDAGDRQEPDPGDVLSGEERRLMDREPPGAVRARRHQHLDHPWRRPEDAEDLGGGAAADDGCLQAPHGREQATLPCGIPPGEPEHRWFGLDPAASEHPPAGELTRDLQLLELPPPHEAVLPNSQLVEPPVEVMPRHENHCGTCP